MKKVLIVGMTAGVGGVETFICNVLKRIDQTKYEIYILMHEKMNDKYIKELENVRYKLIEVSGIKQNPLKYFIEINKVYRQYNFDIVHLNECDATFFVYCLPLLINRKPKLIIHSHNGDTSHLILHKLLSIFQNKRVNTRWACSDVAGKFMFGKKKFTVIKNGIDLQEYKYSDEKRKRIRRELGINDEIVIGSIARFENQKNHTRIISIFEKYHKSNPESKLILVGTGSMLDTIKDLVRQKRIERSVLFLGIRKDIPDIMSSFDLFLMPSLYEGLPFVCVEAQANSLPMLLSDTISEQVKLTSLIDMLSLDDDDDKWIEKIDSIVKESQRNRNYNKELTKSGFSIDETVKIIEKEFK